jgi:hypothetical protein
MNSTWLSPLSGNSKVYDLLAIKDFAYFIPLGELSCILLD